MQQPGVVYTAVPQTQTVYVERRNNGASDEDLCCGEKTIFILGKFLTRPYSLRYCVGGMFVLLP